MRVKIDLPLNFSFFIELAVRVKDLNYADHLSNDAVLSLAHEARMAFMKHLGMTELQIGDGLGLIMADAAIVFKSEAHYGDVLLIEIVAQEFTKAGFELLYRISQVQTQKEVARVKTGMVCFDYVSRKVAFLPEKTRILLES
ncbi:MAG: thioesterase [Bacteroidetes bacterium]|nr:MAG: thioesterase [Bacteroidota bacterium]